MLGVLGTAMGGALAVYLLDVPELWLEGIRGPIRSVRLERVEAPVDAAGVGELGRTSDVPRNPSAALDEPPPRSEPPVHEITRAARPGEVTDAPAPRPVPPRPKPLRSRVPAPAGVGIIQVAASPRRAWAEALATELRGEGYASFVHEERDGSGRLRYKVRVHAAPGDGVDEVAARLRRSGRDVWVVPQ